MKKIMAIIGSPRKGGNTEILTDHMIKGCETRGAVEADKILVTEKNIQFCNGCLTCVEPDATGCVIKDDMETILERMRSCDGLIFATPNHMRTVTAPLLNFMSRMLPLLKLKVEQDSHGNVTGGAFDSHVRGKKAAIIISQGDPTISSFLAFSFLERNFIDFQLLRVGEIISLGNVSKGEVKNKEHDLQAAFSLGSILAS